MFNEPALFRAARYYCTRNESIVFRSGWPSARFDGQTSRPAFFSVVEIMLMFRKNHGRSVDGRGKLKNEYKRVSCFMFHDYE